VNLDGFALPVKKLKGTDPVEMLDLSGKNLGVASAVVIASLISVNGGLTVTNLLHNSLDAESAKMLAEVAKQKSISLCGIRRDQTTADFSEEYLKPPDTILLASDLSQAVVTGALTMLFLAQNMLGEEGTKAICEALEQNKTLKELDISGAEYESNIGGSAGAKHVAKMLGVNGSLTSVKLRGNKLGGEGWGAIFAAICGNKDSKIMSMDASSESIGPAGVKQIAEALRTSVTGGLTCVDVRYNRITGDGAAQLSAAVLGNLKIEMFNKIPIKEMRADSFTELDLMWKGLCVEGGMVVAGLIPVMGSLTKLSLAWNYLKEKGTKAICEALKQNKTLKELDLSGHNNIGGEAGSKHVADMLGVNGGLTALDLSNNELKDEGVSAVCKAIQSNKETKLASLNFKNNGIGPVGANAVAAMVAVTGALTMLSLARNRLGEEGTNAICEALEQNKSLKELDISGAGNHAGIGGSASAKHVANMLGVNGGLTSLNLSDNQLCGLDCHGRGTYTAEGITAIADALRVNGSLTKIDVSWNIFGPEGAKVFADALRVNGGLTALDLSNNNLKDEGVSAVCKAIQSNKETKLASLNFKNNGIGPVGANAVAAMVAVTGALTVTNLLNNGLDAEYAKMLAEVAKQKGFSLCGIRRDQTTADFHCKDLKPPDAILLASDLSQASVTGALTKLSLAGNKLEEEGTKAVCEALKKNKTLKELDLSGYNNIGGEAGAKHVADMLGVNGSLTKIE
jgi:Ran GTPase-activating protein (RanGAP) involved in mRNA processing and transport